MKASRKIISIAAASGMLLCVMPMCAYWHPRLLYNPSHSMPRGFYAVVPDADIHVNDVVVVRLLDDVAALAAQRHYLPLNVPLIKSVAAVEGQRVCSLNGRVYVDSEWVASARRQDAAGLPLVAWMACRVLNQGEVFLVGTHDASFDSRYFGPLRTTDVIGRAVPLWVW